MLTDTTCVDPGYKGNTRRVARQQFIPVDFPQLAWHLGATRVTNHQEESLAMKFRFFRRARLRLDRAGARRDDRKALLKVAANKPDHGPYRQSHDRMGGPCGSFIGSAAKKERIST